MKWIHRAVKASAVLVALIVSAGCYHNTGQVLASAARPSTTLIDETATKCVSDLVENAKATANEAMEFCLALRQNEADRDKSTARSAAQAEDSRAHALCGYNCYNGSYMLGGGIRYISSRAGSDPGGVSFVGSSGTKTSSTKSNSNSNPGSSAGGVNYNTKTP